MRLLEKAGFQTRGTVAILLAINGVWQDHYLYALIAGDRPARAETGLSSLTVSSAQRDMSGARPGGDRDAVCRNRRARPSSRSRSRATTWRSTCPAPSRSIATRARTSRFRPRRAPTASCGASRSRPTTERSSGDWAVFALANSTDQQLDRLIVAPHFRLVELRAVLARPRLQPHRRDHAQRRFRAGPAAERRRRRLPGDAQPRRGRDLRRRAGLAASCRRSICGTRTPTRTRSTPTRCSAAS